MKKQKLKKKCYKMNDLKNIDDIIYKVNLHPYELDAIIVSLNESLSNNDKNTCYYQELKLIYKKLNNLTPTINEEVIL